MGGDKISLVAFFMVAMCVVFLFVCYGFDNILPEMEFRIPVTNSDAPWNYFVSCMYVLCTLFDGVLVPRVVLGRSVYLSCCLDLFEREQTNCRDN